MDTFHYDSASGFSNRSFAGSAARIGNSLKHILIRDLPLQLLLPLLHHLVDDLTLLQAAVSDGGKNRIPVLKGIAVHYLFHKFRLSYLAPVNALGLTIPFNGLSAPDNIVLLHLILKPLIDLVLGLGALDNIQPVSAGALGIL